MLCLPADFSVYIASVAQDLVHVDLEIFDVALSYCEVPSVGHARLTMSPRAVSQYVHHHCESWFLWHRSRRMPKTRSTTTTPSVPSVRGSSSPSPFAGREMHGFRGMRVTAAVDVAFVGATLATVAALRCVRVLQSVSELITKPGLLAAS